MESEVVASAGSAPGPAEAREAAGGVAELEEHRARQGRWRRFVREARSRPMAYGVLAAFLVAGPFAAAYLFPEAPTAVAVIGGLIFGGYAALCAVPQKFL